MSLSLYSSVYLSVSYIYSLSLLVLSDFHSFSIYVFLSLLDPLPALSKTIMSTPKYTMSSRPISIDKARLEEEERKALLIALGKNKAAAPESVKSLIGTGPKISLKGRPRPPREESLSLDPKKPIPPPMEDYKWGKTGPCYSFGSRPYSGLAFGNWEVGPSIQ
jgi:hypothetical protein